MQAADHHTKAPSQSANSRLFC